MALALSLADHPPNDFDYICYLVKTILSCIRDINHTPGFPFRPSLPDFHPSRGCPRVQHLNNIVNTDANHNDLHLRLSDKSLDQRKNDKAQYNPRKSGT